MNTNYKYDTAHNAIQSLERAYDNKDLKAIIKSKDFETEAFLMLENKGVYNRPDYNELLRETKKLLKLGLIESIERNGYPDFTNLKTEISEVIFVKKNIYVTCEKIIYPDGSLYENKICLTLNNNEWKVAKVEE